MRNAELILTAEGAEKAQRNAKILFNIPSVYSAHSLRPLWLKKEKVGYPHF